MRLHGDDDRAAHLPTGTITFLFTDIEGSTKLLQRLADGYTSLLENHAALIRDAARASGGVDVSSEGDALFLAFPSAPGAVRAAVQAQRMLAGHDWPPGVEVRVRMGLHTGEATLGGDDYVGLDVHRAARIAAAGHGGQVLLSAATRSLVQYSLPEGCSVRDLGAHRLKDLSQPEHLFQLVIHGLKSEFPPLRSLDTAPNNLPVQLTSFVGRERELREALLLLERARLLTLTGPGGTGKTRLSLQIAAEASDRFPDGVFFVPLAVIRDPDLVPSAIAGALGVTVDARSPVLDQVIAHLETKAILLVLDNMEQVVGAAPAVADLLRGAPGVSVVATSRIPLRVSGEQEVPVPPLPVPDPSRPSAPDALARFGSVELFLDRAMAVKADFALSEENAAAVAEIAARLDGLPLAIELAAARIKLLPPKAMAERLGQRLSVLTAGPRDLPARQQTLRDAIAWSYELLPEGAQRLFRRLGVFSGGATLGAAEAVAGPPEELGMPALDGLGVLVDHNLVRVDEAADGPRFWMLETIREFSLLELENSGEAAQIRARHADFFLELAAQAEPLLMGHDRGRWLDRLDLEHDNLRAALDNVVAEGDGEAALDGAAALWRFWQQRGHLREARTRLERALGLWEAWSPARARALEAAGGVAYWQGDSEGVRTFYGEALEIAREGGKPAEVANALYNLSFAFAEEPETAETLLLEALGICRQLGDPARTAGVVWALAQLLDRRGDHEGAYRHYQESLRLYREADDPFGVGWALFTLATNAVARDDLGEARALFTESLELFASVVDTPAIMLHLAAFALLAFRDGDRERAVQLLAAFMAIRGSIGAEIAGIDEQVPRQYHAMVEALRGDVETLLDRGAAPDLDQALALARGS